MDSWLLRAAARRPTAEALSGVPYATLAERVDDAARRIAGHGVGPGDRVALELPPGEAFVVLLHALLRVGAVAVPIDPRAPEADRAARRAIAAWAVDDERLLDELAPDPDAALRSTHDLDAPAIVVHTSGTSGAAKPIPLTHGNWLWSALGSAAALGCPPGERWLCALPLHHVGGLSVLLRSAIAGTTAVVHERWETERVVAALTGAPDPETGRPQAPATMTSVVPTTLRRLLDAGLRGGAGGARALRFALLGGAPIPPGLLVDCAEAGLPVAPTYGMTEACSQIATLGSPLFCTTVATADDGELLVRGPTVAPAAVRADGWLATGDLGRLDGRGHLEVTGRKADTIITGGENVLPLEVERALEALPGVAEAGVFARPDDRWGERVCAQVVALPGATLDVGALRDAVARRLARHQVPREIEVVPALPRTTSGKLLRRALR